MTDISIKVREHYGATGLTGRLKEALTTIAPENQALTVDQLAPLDHFHTRGILATAELARAAGLDPSTPVLDLGCGVGGPARYLAATFDRYRPASARNSELLAHDTDVPKAQSSDQGLHDLDVRDGDMGWCCWRCWHSCQFRPADPSGNMK
jgi:hypothetical protein